jgi:hypothetical protein
LISFRIDFAGVTVAHLITGEVETYEVDYKPLKHAKDSAGGGYGQGRVVDASPGAKAPAARPATAARPAQARPPAGSTQAIAGRVGQYMQNLSPQQRQQFMQQLQKQNAATAKKNGASPQKPANGSAGSKRTSGKKRR